MEEAERFSRLLQGHISGQARTLLHLGCGAGHHDFTFKRHFQVTGVDVSTAMLRLARRLNPDATYRQGDMRTVRLDQTFDAVVALDSASYLTSEADLCALFATAFHHLRPGGVFLTVAEETRERFQQDRTVGATYSREALGVTFMEHLYDPDPTDSTCEATFIYLIRRRGRLQIETDRHLFGLFPLETWIRLLTDTGFHVRQFEYSPPERQGLPIFVCRKL